VSPATRVRGPSGFTGPEEMYDTSAANAEYASRGMEKFDHAGPPPHMKMHVEGMEGSAGHM
jgi:hypothetical protein